MGKVLSDKTNLSRLMKEGYWGKFLKGLVVKFALTFCKGHILIIHVPPAPGTFELINYLIIVVILSVQINDAEFPKKICNLQGHV